MVRELEVLYGRGGGFRGFDECDDGLRNAGKGFKRAFNEVVANSKEVVPRGEPRRQRTRNKEFGDVRSSGYAILSLVNMYD